MKETILRTELLGKFADDPGTIKDVMRVLPKRVEDTLNYYRTQVFGHQPRDRESFDPGPVLRSLQGGEKIVVSDSKKDLPNNWRYFDLNSFFNDNQNKGSEECWNEEVKVGVAMCQSLFSHTN